MLGGVHLTISVLIHLKLEESRIEIHLKLDHRDIFYIITTYVEQTMKGSYLVFFLNFLLCFYFDLFI